MKATLEERKAFVKGMSQGLDFGLMLDALNVDFWTAISSLNRQTERCNRLSTDLYGSDEAYFYHGYKRGCEELIRQIVNKGFLK